MFKKRNNWILNVKQVTEKEIVKLYGGFPVCKDLLNNKNLLYLMTVLYNLIQLLWPCWISYELITFLYIYF